MARLHLAAWVHWRGDHRLAWETEEPLPPPPDRLPGRRIPIPASA
jgi:hypothetical protein